MPSANHSWKRSLNSGEPVEAVLEVAGPVDEVAPAGLAEPVEEVPLVGVTEHDLVERFAVDDAGDPALLDVLVAVDQPAGVTRLAGDDRQPDQPLTGLLGELVERAHLSRLVEHLLLVEAPPPQRDADLAHVPTTEAA